MVFNLGMSPYETWFVTRMHPPDKIFMDSNKALLLALKAFYKSDVPASVVYNSKYLWTACLGKERVIIPVSHQETTTLQFYATPYYVNSLNVMSQYLQGIIRPAYENVFFYKNTVLFLDPEDLPFPGGFYFDPCEPTSYYRICFLSNESMDYVLNVASEWQSRQNILTIPYMTRDTQAIPKFIPFQPISEFGFQETHITSTGIVRKTLSSEKSEFILQDILNAYYKNVARRVSESQADIGLLIEWPLLITFEGARYSDTQSNKQFVALSVNGSHPNRVLQVYRPYDRYIEYNQVPATLWTPISFVLSTLLTDSSIRKVAIDTVVIGVVYREAFFCLDHPLLEGTPTHQLNVNGNYILSPVDFDLKNDSTLQVLESFRLNESYSLKRVSLKGVSLNTWCLTKSAPTDPYPKKIRLTGLVKQWTDFFMEVGENKFDMDISTVRLALMLSKHTLCFHLNAVDKTRQAIKVTENEVNFDLNGKIVQFINEARLIKEEPENPSATCTLS